MAGAARGGEQRQARRKESIRTEIFSRDRDELVARDGTPLTGRRQLLWTAQAMHQLHNNALHTFGNAAPSTFSNVSLPRVAYGFMSRAPRPGATARAACDAEDDVLACAFDTWVPRVGAAGVGVLCDCGAPCAGSHAPLNGSGPFEEYFPAASAAADADAPCRPAWLSASASKALPTSFRCFFGGTWTAMSGVCSTHHNYRKAAALFEMLVLDFPAAELFVKLDTDAVLFPRLMRPWLRELAAAAAAAPATGGAVSLGERRLYIGTSAKMHKYTYCNDSRRVCARSSADWIALEQDIAGWNTSDAERRKRKAEVKYAWGGMEVLSAGLVRAIVGPRCIERVAAVRCRGWGRGRDANLCEWAVDFEDAAVGLCAHLLGARLTEQRCFARYEEGHQKWDLINCRPRRAFIAVHGSPHKAAAGYRRTWREGHNASSKFFVGGPLHTLNHREETA